MEVDTVSLLLVKSPPSLLERTVSGGVETREERW